MIKSHTSRWVVNKFYEHDGTTIELLYYYKYAVRKVTRHPDGKLRKKTIAHYYFKDEATEQYDDLLQKLHKKRVKDAELHLAQVKGQRKTNTMSVGREYTIDKDNNLVEKIKIEPIEEPTLKITQGAGEVTEVTPPKRWVPTKDDGYNKYGWKCTHYCFRSVPVCQLNRYVFLTKHKEPLNKVLIALYKDKKIKPKHYSVGLLYNYSDGKNFLLSKNPHFETIEDAIKELKELCGGGQHITKRQVLENDKETHVNIANIVDLIHEGERL